MRACVCVIRVTGRYVLPEIGSNWIGRQCDSKDNANTLKHPERRKKNLLPNIKPFVGWKVIGKYLLSFGRCRMLYGTMSRSLFRSHTVGGVWLALYHACACASPESATNFPLLLLCRWRIQRQTIHKNAINTSIMANEWFLSSALCAA